jgi:hypothetical protein
MRRRWLLGLWVVAACQCGEDPRGGNGFRDGGRLDVGVDSGAKQDGSPGDGSTFDVGDGGDRPDAWGDDGGQQGDSGALEDTGAPSDGGAPGDGGSDDGGSLPVDSGAFDSGFVDSGVFDSGFVDSGVFDSGFVDSGAFDSGFVDSGVPLDAMVPDTGLGAGDLSIEINYQSAFSPSSPSWTYSASPGWSPNDWDFTGGGNGAEAWDRFNNMSVVNDPIGGNVLEIGGSSELQLMFGLVSMQSYTTATVELEGRSRACCSGVTFDVYNPATGCGDTATMSQDWTADIVVLDLTGCFTPGSALQAVRVDPTSGAIALRRMRLTFTGAVW